MPRKPATACGVRTCPNLRPCPDHVPVQASREERGYGRRHLALRAQWQPRVQRGEVRCARCRGLILPGSEWALDHSDDRTSYLGPSHKHCNDSAGGKAAHRHAG